MSMVCPRCNTTFEDRNHCPSCGIPLVAYGPSVEGGSGVYSRPKWQQTSWGRVLVGLLLALGLYAGLWQLSTAAILAMVEESARTGWWNSTAGCVLQQILLAVSVFAGGMMAGAGQKRSVFYGALLGFVNGLIFLAMPKDRTLSTLEMYGQPFIQMVFGMAGAWVGGLIWKPMVAIVPSPPLLGTTPPPVGQLHLRPLPATPFMAGPINWGRVIVGIVVAVLGSSWASLILKWILVPESGFELQSQYQAKFVTWEISALALILGAGFAGSNSRSGAKQGLVVGLGVSAGLIGVYFQLGGITAPAPTLIVDLLRLDLKLEPKVQTIIFTLLVVIPLALAGGWFGGQLLPPLKPSRRKDQTPAWV